MSKKKSKAVEKPWPLWKDQVVLFYMSGMTQEEVATHMSGIGHKMTRQSVSNILKDPRAGEIIAAARSKFKEVLIEGIGDELDVASKLALKAIKKTLEAEIHPIHQAKANQDRVALKVLSGRGFLREDSRNEDAGLQVPPDQFERLVKAMERSNRAREQNPYEDYEDAEIEVIEDESDS
jgi:hypothetical protein